MLSSTDGQARQTPCAPDTTSDGEAVRWAMLGAVAMVGVVAVHEGAHAVAAVALGYGPVDLSLWRGVESAAISPVLQALDAGGGVTAAAAVAPGGALGRAMLPTWAGVVTTYLTWAGAALVLRREARRDVREAAGGDRVPSLARIAAAICVVAVSRFVSAISDAISAAIDGRTPTPGDEARMAAALGSPVAAFAVLLTVGFLMALATPPMIREAIGQRAPWRWVGCMLVIGAFFGLVARAAVPKFVLGG